MGAGAAGAVVLGPRAALGAGGPAAAAAVGPCSHAVGMQPTFGRIFDLQPFAYDSPKLRAAMLEIAKAGGLLDAGDALERGAIDLIVDPELSANNSNNETQSSEVSRGRSLRARRSRAPWALRPRAT